MMKRLYKLLSSAVIPLGSFVFYWAETVGGGNTFGGTGALVTVILIVTMYLYFPISKWIERFSPAWSFGIVCSIGFCLIGLMMDLVGGYAWGAYTWFFFLWITADFIDMPNAPKHHYQLSFFKRQKPIEEEPTRIDKAEVLRVLYHRGSCFTSGN